MREFDTSKNQYAVCMIQVLGDLLQVEKLGTFHNNWVYENEDGRSVVEIDETYDWGTILDNCI